MQHSIIEGSYAKELGAISFHVQRGDGRIYPGGWSRARAERVATFQTDLEAGRIIPGFSVPRK